MKYNLLPNTDIKVSNICLGTMTFGQQNTESEGHSQIDFALDKGINFLDTAEMYSIPPKKETYGSTEKVIGTWFKKSGRRDQVVLATKIAGPNPNFGYMRDNVDFSPASIRFALDQSLTRLQSDYVDLYQLHWPERKSNMFGQLGFKIQEDAWQDNMKAILESLQELIQEGKIRAIGVSNETPWGLMRFLQESKAHHLPKMSTIQNPYSLLNRSFEVGLSEVAHRENVGLLAYSPLAFGVLSGKFLTGEAHPNARINLFPQYVRYNSEQSKSATALYNAIAKENKLTLVQLALAFIQQQKMVTSTIIGATSLTQLEENINAFQTVLSDEIMMAIDKVQQIHPNPAP